VEPDAEAGLSCRGFRRRISISTLLRGYRLSPKNRSFEPLNGTSLRGISRGRHPELNGPSTNPERPLRADTSDNAKWQVLAEKYKRLSDNTIGRRCREPESAGAGRAASASQTSKSTPKPAPLPKIELPPALPEVAGADALPGQDGSGRINRCRRQTRANGQVWLPCKWVSRSIAERATRAFATSRVVFNWSFHRPGWQPRNPSESDLVGIRSRPCDWNRKIIAPQLYWRHTCGPRCRPATRRIRDRICVHDLQ